MYCSLKIQFRILGTTRIIFIIAVYLNYVFIILLVFCVKNTSLKIKDKH